jgi:hypothetical protein
MRLPTIEELAALKAAIEAKQAELAKVDPLLLRRGRFVRLGFLPLLTQFARVSTMTITVL